MEKTVLILSITECRYGYEIIAIDIANCKFMRIVDIHAEKYKGVSNEIILNNDIKALDIITITKLEPCPTPIHPEDYTISKSSSYTHKKNNNFKNVQDIVQKCPKFDTVGILGNEAAILPPDASEFSHSIELVNFGSAKLSTTTSKYNGKAQTKTRMSFICNGVHYKELLVLDPDEALEENESKAYLSGYILVSFSEDIWSKKHGYTKHVAKIFHEDARIDDRTPKKNNFKKFVRALLDVFKPKSKK